MLFSRFKGTLSFLPKERSISTGEKCVSFRSSLKRNVESLEFPLGVKISEINLIDKSDSFRSLHPLESLNFCENNRRFIRLAMTGKNTGRVSNFVEERQVWERGAGIINDRLCTHAPNVLEQSAPLLAHATRRNISTSL